MTNRSSVLYREFPGDEAWAKFVVSFPILDQNFFEKIGIKDDVARVLYFKKGNDAHRVIEWLSKPIPALDNVAPKTFLDSADGERVLKALIMRMP